MDIGPEGFTFAAQAELYPEVKLGKYKGLAAPMPQAELSNDDVDKAESEWLQAHLVEEERDRAAMGDEVTLDFDGSVDGVPFARPRTIPCCWAAACSSTASRSRWRGSARRRSGRSM